MKGRPSSAGSVTGMLCLVLLAFYPAVPVSAHHAVLAKFDNDHPLSLAGVVTRVDWKNPHAHIFVNVPGDGGEITNWAVELESPVLLELNGWTLQTLAPGDVIAVDGMAARDGSFQLWGERVILQPESRALFTLDDSLQSTYLERQNPAPAPRWPDGRPRLEAAPGAPGYWSVPGASSLVEDGVSVAFDADGLLLNLADADRVAPFKAWARDLYVHRQRQYLKDDPAYINCIPPGGPRHFQMPFPFGLQFVEDRARDRLFIVTGGGNSNWRVIYTDPAAFELHAPAPDLRVPVFYGNSIGRWEGDTLVVETGNFNEAFWFSNGGLPHTGMLQLTERISRPDMNTLRYEVTIDDPGAYTRPWTSSWTLQWIPGADLPEHFCQGNRP